MEKKRFQRHKIIFIIILVMMIETSTSKSATESKNQISRKVLVSRNQVNWQEIVNAYMHCYEVFRDHFGGATYHVMCLIRDKLNVCKQKVKTAFPRVEDFVIKGIAGEYEFTAKFWCTHKPYELMPIEALYYKFYHCPYVYPWFMVLPQDYSAQESLSFRRVKLAYAALKSITDPNLTKWHPQSNYSDPTDPVYQALSSVQCAYLKNTQYVGHIVDKYCIFGDVYRDLHEQTSRYYQLHMDGLYNWDPSKCPSAREDPMEKMLHVAQLESWLKLQINSSLEQCHASNVAISGATCIIMYHIQLPPFTDLHLFMRGFCKPIEELHQCWEEVVQMCPKQSVNSDMDILIKLHQLACDISLQDSELVWNVIYSWAGAVKKIKGSQLLLQELAIFMESNPREPLLSTAVLPLPFAQTLNATLTVNPRIPSEIQDLLLQLIGYLNRVNLLQTYHFQGLNILYELDKIHKNIAEIISIALFGPVQLLLTVGDFIDYDPKNFRQWTFFY